MTTVKQYVAGQVQPTKASGSAYLPENINAPVERAASNLKQAFGGIAKVTEAYAQQERDNLLLEEEDRMNKNLAQLENDVAQMPYRDQRQAYEDGANRIKAELEKRHDDRYVVNALRGKWNNATYAGTRRVNEVWRNGTLQDAVAGLQKSNNAFLNNIDVTWNDPATFNTQLIDQMVTIDKLVSNGTIAADKGETLKADLHSKADFGRVKMMIANDPQRALKSLKDTNQLDGLTASTRATLIEQTEADINRIKREEEREARLALMERRTIFNTTKTEMTEAINAFSATGRKPQEWDHMFAFAAKNADLDGGVMYNKMHNTYLNQADLQEFKSLSVADQNEKITKLQTTANAGQLNSRQQLLIQDYQKINNDLTEAMHNGDLIGYVQKYNIKQIAPLDVMNLDSVAKRNNDVGTMADAIGTDKFNKITEDEANDIEELYERSNREDKQRIAVGLARLGEDNVDRLLNQIGQKDPSIRTELTFLMSNNRQDQITADLMAEGRKAVTANKDRYNVGDLRNEIQKRLSKTSVGLLDTNGRKLASITTAATNIYAALNPDHKDKGIDKDTLDKAMSRLGLGDMVEINGFKIPPFQRGMTARQTRQVFNVLDEEILTLGGNGYPMIAKPNGGTRRPSIQDIRKKAVLVPTGEGIYSLAFKNAANDEMFFAVNESTGQRYQFNYHTVRENIATAINKGRQTPINLPTISGP